MSASPWHSWLVEWHARRPQDHAAMLRLVADLCAQPGEEAAVATQAIRRGASPEALLDLALHLNTGAWVAVALSALPEPAQHRWVRQAMARGADQWVNALPDYPWAQAQPVAKEERQVVFRHAQSGQPLLGWTQACPLAWAALHQQWDLLHVLWQHPSVRQHQAGLDQALHGLVAGMELNRHTKPHRSARSTFTPRPLVRWARRWLAAGANPAHRETYALAPWDHRVPFKDYRWSTATEAALEARGWCGIGDQYRHTHRPQERSVPLRACSTLEWVLGLPTLPNSRRDHPPAQEQRWLNHWVDLWAKQWTVEHLKSLSDSPTALFLHAWSERYAAAARERVEGVPERQALLERWLPALVAHEATPWWAQPLDAEHPMHPLWLAWNLAVHSDMARRLKEDPLQAQAMAGLNALSARCVNADPEALWAMAIETLGGLDRASWVQVLYLQGDHVTLSGPRPQLWAWYADTLAPSLSPAQRTALEAFVEEAQATIADHRAQLETIDDASHPPGYSPVRDQAHAQAKQVNDQLALQWALLAEAPQPTFKAKRPRL